MSKQKQIVEEKKDKYVTIGEFFESVLEDEACRVLRMVPCGNFYAATKKPNGEIKKPARGTIAFPIDSLGDTTDLRFLRKWNFYIIAIPIEEKELKEDEKNERRD